MIRPSRDLDIVPDPDPDNFRRLAQLLGDLDARQLGIGDLEPDEFPFDPTRAENLERGANFRLETSLGDLDIMQWVAGIDAEPAFAALAVNAISGELDGIPLEVCGLEDLVAMKRAAGRPRDLGGFGESYVAIVAHAQPVRVPGSVYLIMRRGPLPPDADLETQLPSLGREAARAAGRETLEG